MHLRIFHVSGVSVPVPPKLAHRSVMLKIFASEDYECAHIGTGVI